jgi:hypothetical protein
MPDFEQELKALKSAENVVSFLRGTTRQVLVQALREPQLFKDLKLC